MLTIDKAKVDEIIDGLLGDNNLTASPEVWYGLHQIKKLSATEVVRCGECTHYIPILSNWGKCGVHSSPTEKYRTCQICDYCSWAEKREEKSKYVKNPLSTL